MKNQELNSEARSIVKEILIGSIDLARYTGWDLTVGSGGSQLISNPRQVIQPGTYINIIPFGDKIRCRNIDKNKKRISNPNDFEGYFEKTYDFKYKDGLTFLSLLKSYVAGMAQQENIKNCFVITITDNLIDETGSIPYSKIENTILNAYDTEKNTKVQNIGIIDKSIGHETCKIVMEKFEQFDTNISVEDIYKPTDKNNDTIEVTSPVKFKTAKNNGTKKDPLISKDFKIELKWNGGVAPYSLVIRQESTGKKIFDESISSNSRLIKFNNSGLYSASISDAKGTLDTVFIDQAASFPWGLLIGALICAFIAYYLFKTWSDKNNNVRKKKSQDKEEKDPFPNPDNPSNGSSTPSDW
jgi:hypothetical protein